MIFFLQIKQYLNIIDILTFMDADTLGQLVEAATVTDFDSVKETTTYLSQILPSKDSVKEHLTAAGIGLGMAASAAITPLIKSKWLDRNYESEGIQGSYFSRRDPVSENY